MFVALVRIKTQISIEEHVRVVNFVLQKCNVPLMGTKSGGIPNYCKITERQFLFSNENRTSQMFRSNIRVFRGNSSWANWTIGKLTDNLSFNLYRGDNRKIEKLIRFSKLVIVIYYICNFTIFYFGFDFARKQMPTNLEIILN